MANLPLTEFAVPDYPDYIFVIGEEERADIETLQNKVAALEETTEGIPAGTFPELTAGSVLSKDAYTKDTLPYLYRAMPYVSKRLEESLVGGSVVWNQLASLLDSTHWSSAVSGTTNVQFSDGVASFLGTAQYAGLSLVGDYRPPSLKNHKYFFTVTAKAGSNADLQARSFGGYGDINLSVTTDWTTASKVFDLPDGDLTLGNRAILLRDKRVSGWDTVSFKNIMLIDLTAMFGSTIADYVYTLEQATTGSGIAWLKSYGFFTKPYYEYDTGTIKSVNPIAHKMVGVNAWDEEWEQGGLSTVTGEPEGNLNAIRSKNFVPCVPSMDYWLTTQNPASYLWFYDANKNFMSFSTNVANRIFTTPSGCHYMKLRVGDSSHQQTTYNHDICINISDSKVNGKYFPYEEHTYDLGDVTLRGIPKLVNNELIYDGDTYTHDGAVQRNTIFRAYQAGDESLANALTDGTNTVVYSANASTETTSPFEQYQVCETGGTEEYTTTNDVPVGHDTKYFTDVIGNIEDIPAPPTADGTYTLKVTVSSGVPTYAWV